MPPFGMFPGWPPVPQPFPHPGQQQMPGTASTTPSVNATAAEITTPTSDTTQLPPASGFPNQVWYATIAGGLSGLAVNSGSLNLAQEAQPFLLRLLLNIYRILHGGDSSGVFPSTTLMSI